VSQKPKYQFFNCINHLSTLRVINKEAFRIKLISFKEDNILTTQNHKVLQYPELAIKLHKLKRCFKALCPYELFVFHACTSNLWEPISRLRLCFTLKVWIFFSSDRKVVHQYQVIRLSKCFPCPKRRNKVR